MATHTPRPQLDDQRLPQRTPNADSTDDRQHLRQRTATPNAESTEVSGTILPAFLGLKQTIGRIQDMATDSPRPHIQCFDDLQQRILVRPNGNPLQTFPVPMIWNLRYHTRVQHPFIREIGVGGDMSPCNLLHVVEVFEVLKSFDRFWKCRDGFGTLSSYYYVVQRHGDPRLILVEFPDMSQAMYMKFFLESWFEWEPVPAQRYILILEFDLYNGKWQMINTREKHSLVAMNAKVDLLKHLLYKEKQEYLPQEMWDAITKYK